MSRKGEAEQTHTPTGNDPKMEGMTGSGVRWSVYDTYCKEFGPEEKARADRELYEIFKHARQRGQVEKKEEA